MIAEVNRTLEGIETMLLFSEPALAHISSSMVREIHRFGREIDDYLPLPLQEKQD
jgi:pantetheine-phosphate adenylyltransferase